LYNNAALTISKTTKQNNEEKSMISAVVLVNTELGSSHDQVIESLKLIEGVEEAHGLYGVYDLMVKIKAQTIDKLKDIIKLQIKHVAGITSSLTLMIIDR
jgi:DNA-binding Lrp family transcriptional regulator